MSSQEGERAASPPSNKTDCAAEMATQNHPNPPLPRRLLDRPERMRKKFLDDEPMIMNDDGVPEAPSCSLEAMRHPRLRRCAFDTSTMVFTGPINRGPRYLDGELDGGLDGYNWKIRFGKSGPFVMKVFWDQEPSLAVGYFALQRECHNAATLQMMQAALAKDDQDMGPILVHEHPWERGQARWNTHSFSDERRLEKKTMDAAKAASKAASMTRITSMPRIRKCYGWTKISYATLHSLPWSWRPPQICVDKQRRQLEDREYVAIVYEYVKEGENDEARIQESLDFFRRAGFSNALTSLHRNWKQSVLIDMSDITYSGGSGWKSWSLQADCVMAAL